MSLQELLYEEQKKAFKEKKEPDLSTLRLLKSEIQYELTKTGSSILQDEQILQIIKKNIVRRKDTAIEYRKANRIDLAEKEESEANFLEKFLPPSLKEEELIVIIQETITQLGATGQSDVGKVMGKVMASIKGKNVDGNLVSSLVKKLLSESAQ
jgi:uncharacterized protein